MSDPQQPSRMNINSQTGISIGIVIVLLGGFSIVVKGINDNRSETTNVKTELSIQAMSVKTEITGQISELKTRINNLEAGKNSWTSTDMFKWAVHLQQANSDPKKLQSEGLKVPEPEVNTK